MAKTSRLNGWHRLYLLVSVIYLFGVATVSAFLYPQPPSYGENLQGERFGGSLALVKKYLKSDPDFVLQGRPLPSEFGGIPQGQEALEQEIARLHAKYAGRVDFSSVEAKFAHDSASKRVRFIGIVFLVWFVPVALIYLLGVAVSWVIKGFRQS